MDSRDQMVNGLLLLVGQIDQDPMFISFSLCNSYFCVIVILKCNEINYIVINVIFLTISSAPRPVNIAQSQQSTNVPREWRHSFTIPRLLNMPETMVQSKPLIEVPPER